MRSDGASSENALMSEYNDPDYYERYHDWEPDDDYFEAEEESFQARVAERIEEVFDDNFKAIFRSKVADWSAARWPIAEQAAYRVGREARAFAENGHDAAAVVWAATCVEIIFRDLTLKPVFTGLFLGGAWADEALEAMLRNRWVRDDTRAIAKNALHAVAGIEVEGLEVAGTRPWNEIQALLRKRNRIAHHGEEATEQEAGWAVDVAAALYGSLLPPLRELCGLMEREDYRAPEDGAGL
jgi:hypothetical protein